MITCSPQRYLANNRNALRTAALTPSSVQPIEDAVLAIPFARVGTAQVALTGPYTGAEEATYDVEVVDDSSTTNLISAPVFSGAGSGTLSSIAASGTPQNFEIELADSGAPATEAFVDFEGVQIVARYTGVGGNLIRILIDQSTLVFTPSSFSLLDDLPVGAGSDTAGLEGAAFDWDTAVIGSDNQIPASAHRVSFGADKSIIYLAYKRFDSTKWTYHFVPEIKRAVPKGTIVNFVTGGRDVHVTAGGSPGEDFPGVVTVFDLLEALKLGSQYADVAGVVANDRSPTGQAARELTLRTDAHCEPSYGSGGAATGFVDTFADSDAGTELVTATCVAITGKDNPTASLGNEIWKVAGSLSGTLDNARTGVAYLGPSWGFTVPRKLPDNYGAPKGRFSVTDIQYVGRQTGENAPPICVVAMELGPNAVDQSITLRYTARPSGNCLCNGLPIPNLRTACLGLFDTTGDGSMSYSATAVLKLRALYDWAGQLASALTEYRQGFVRPTTPNLAVVIGTGPASGSTTLGDISMTQSAPLYPGSDLLTMLPDYLTAGFAEVGLPDNFQECIDFYEEGIAAIDAVTDSALKAAGFDQWDVALQAFQDDLGGSPLMGSPFSGFGERLASIALAKYKILVKQAMAYAGIAQLGKADADTITSGDGCWRDWNDPLYWEVVGSDGGKYAPAFNNHPYYASRLASDGKAYFSTKEFAFQINIKCPGDLKEGDEIFLSIGGSGFAPTYQIGDTLTLPIIAAQPFFLAGGQDANELQKWFVTASIDGPLAQFTYNLSDTPPVSYSNGGLSFDLTVGGIPFEKGDKFTFGVESAHYRWRKNGGAWSGSIAVPTSPAAFDSGLSIAFTTGAEPSFVAGDTFKFRALQPWAVSNVQSPVPNRWEWDEASPTLVADFGSPQTLDMAAIALHTLPDGVTITIEGGTAPGVYLWSETLTRREGVIFGAFTATRSARYVRLSLTGALDAGIGWFWIGQGMSTELSASVQITRSYKIIRGSAGLRSVGKFVGKAISGSVQWSEGALTETDAANVAGMVDWLKANHDEPFVLVPQITRATDIALAQIVSDDVDIIDVSEYNRDAAFARRFSATLPLSGKW